jgi:hypothetical protein
MCCNGFVTPPFTMKTQIAHAPGDNARDEARNRQEALGPEAVASTPAAASLNPESNRRFAIGWSTLVIAVVWTCWRILGPSNVIDSKNLPLGPQAQIDSSVSLAPTQPAQSVSVKPVRLGGIAITFPPPMAHGPLPLPPAQSELLSQNEFWTAELPGFEFILTHLRYSPVASQPPLANAASGAIEGLQRLAPDLKHGIADTFVDGLPAKLVECTYTAEGTSSRLLMVCFDLGRDRWLFELQGNSADQTITEKFQQAVASIEVRRSLSPSSTGESGRGEE